MSDEGERSEVVGMMVGVRLMQVAKVVEGVVGRRGGIGVGRSTRDSRGTRDDG